MNILMCITADGGRSAADFKRTITGVPGINITSLCRTVEELHQKLRSPWDLFDLAILFAGSENELKEYISFQELLEGFPVLLVIPDGNDDLCLMAHQLRPRFISCADSDFTDVVAVLQKMMNNRSEEQIAAGAMCN